MDFIKKIKSVREFLGDEAWWHLTRAIIIGVFWFGVESSFLFVMQALLAALGLATASVPWMDELLPKSILGASILLISYGFFRSVIIVLREYYAGATGQSFVRRQRERIGSKALRHVSAITSYDFMALFTDTVNRSELVVLQMTQFTNLVTSALLLFVLGLRISPVELIIGMVLLGVFIYPINLLTRKISATSSDLTLEWQRINKTIHLGIKNNFLLRVHRMVDHEVGRLHDALKNFERIYGRLHIITGLKGSVPVFVGIFVLSVILFVSRSYLNSNGLTLMSFFYVFIRISQAASEGSVALSNLKINWPALRQLYRWDVEASEIEESEGDDELDFANVLKQEPFEFKVSDLNFTYPGQQGQLIKGINLKLNQGQVLLIKGKSGSGKSTLLSLILGILKPTVGSVTLNGVEIRKIKRSFSSILGYVGPEPYLFPGTVLENLIYGLHSRPGRDQIEEALRKACVYSDVMRLPGQLDEVLTEATQLSTGQKQRLAIARAYLRDPKILVWDEATANLDSELESACIKNLIENANERVVIVVSHKPTFDAVATDRIEFGSD